MSTTRQPLRSRVGGAALVAVVCSVAALLAFPTSARASTAPGLGNAGAYAVLAGTPSITNVGLSKISGNVGISPAAAVTGFPPAIITNGTLQANTQSAAAAQANLTTAYGVATSAPCNFNKTGQNLGGLTLTPGTYCQTTAPTLTGTLTLSGKGVFIFQLGSTLVTAPGSRVVLTNGALACNVFWQVSSSATIATTSQFVGTVLALTSITVQNGATVSGRLLARNGTVTLINDQITVPSSCVAAQVSTPATVPVPSTGAGAGDLTGGTLLGGGLLVAMGSAVIAMAILTGVSRRRHSRVRVNRTQRHTHDGETP